MYWIEIEIYDDVWKRVGRPYATKKVALSWVSFVKKAWYAYKARVVKELGNPPTKERSMAARDDDFETGEIVQVSNCTFVGGSTDNDVVVKFNSSPFEYCLPCSVIRHIQPAQAEPVEAKEPWKPKKGEKVLVEALVRKVYRDMTVCVDIFDVNNDSDWAIVNLSQLRPLPVVQGEGVGK